MMTNHSPCSSRGWEEEREGGVGGGRRRNVGVDAANGLLVWNEEEDSDEDKGDGMNVC